MYEVQDEGRLIVLNKGDNTVSFIKAKNGKTQKTVPVDADPHEVVVTSDEKVSYVSCSVGNSVFAIDTESFEIIDRITHPEFDFVHGVGITKDGSQLWLASTQSRKVFVVSIPDHDFINVIATGQRQSHMIYFTPDGERVYVPNIGSDNLTLIDVASQKILEHIPVGAGPEGASVHPDGETIYVANQHEDELEILSTETHRTLYKQKISTGPSRLVISPDGKYALANGRVSNDISVIDSTLPAEVKRISAGISPGGIVFNHSGSYAYVANSRSNDVSVLDMDLLEEVATFKVGVHPDGIGYVST